MTEKCIWCEVPNGLAKSKGEQYVTIHLKCLERIIKSRDLAMEGLTKVQNLASHEYGEVYHTNR
jgi:hypothetical protein